MNLQLAHDIFILQGRTALHMSASRGRNRLMEWLVRHSSEAFINARDRESGYTPLHRSVFYGQIHAAVALLKIGTCFFYCKCTKKKKYSNPMGANKSYSLLVLGH